MRMRRHGRRSVAGLTLLEMLVALGVFAVIGLMSGQIVIQMVDVNERTRTRSDRLVDVQRAVEIIRRDIQQLAHRTVRDEIGDPEYVLDIDQAELLRFTRRGWSNPRQERRSELQRVVYRLEGDVLYRLFWPVLDRGADTQPITQLLLRDVETIDVSAIDVSGARHAYWPLTGEFAADPERELAAIVVRVAVAPFGEIERLWSVPFSGAPREEGDADTLDEAEEGDEEEPSDSDSFANTPIDALS